jgi:hypothetical protein
MVRVLASETCVHCENGRRRSGSVCACVWRGLFRRCMGWLRTNDDHLMRVAGKFALPSVEFRADVELLAKQNLDTLHHRVFTAHYLNGADWRLCTRWLGIDKGTFFHCVYRVAVALGKAFWLNGLYTFGEYVHVRSSFVRRSPAEVIPFSLHKKAMAA